jgi:hypothetical protein
MNNTESRIYFTEKDIYDALISSKKTMTTPLIIELARDRGLILSSEDSREDLIKYLSSFIYDYYDLNILIDHLTPSHKKEKSKISKIDSKIDSSHLTKAAKDISVDNDSNINIQITADSYNKDKKIVKIAYDEIDFSKTRLRQKVRRESTVEIFEENNITKIRKPANKKVDEIMQSLLSKIEKTSNETLEEKKINLIGLSLEQKTEFFTTLTNNIDGCEMFDVNKISVNKNDNIIEDEDEELEAKDDFINMITNASFKGQGLLQTDEYQNLKKSGYSISSISWLSKQKKDNGNKIQFDASLSKSKTMEELSFSVRGMYRYDDAKNHYTSSIRPLKPEENQYYSDILEKNAFTIYEGILEKNLKG